jgi:hypothetical protein
MSADDFGNWYSTRIPDGAYPIYNRIRDAMSAAEERREKRDKAMRGYY